MCVTTSASGELAAGDERGEPADLRARVARAVVGAADPLLGQELERGQRAPRRRAGRCRRRSPSRPGAGRPRPSRIVVGAPDRPRTRGRRRRGRARARRRPRRRRARRPRRSRRGARASSSLAGSRSTATIGAAPASAGGGHDLQADAAAADHADALARARPAPRSARRRSPVTTPQPSERRLPQRQPGRERDRAARRRRRCAPRSRPTKLKCCSGVPSREPQPGRPVHQRAPPSVLARRLAQVEAPGAAGAARRHAGDEAERHVVARRDVVTPAPTASTTPAPSWPSTIGQRPSPSCAVGEVHVGVADARGRDAHEHLAGARRRRARPPRPRAASRPRAARRRASASPDPPALERVEVRLDAEPRAVRRARSSRRRRSRPAAAEQPVAPLRRPRRRVERHLEVRAGREGERGVQVGEQAEPVRPRVRATQARPQRSASAAIRRQPPMPPESTTSGCTTSTPPRSTRSRASAAPRTISPAAIRSVVSRRSAAYPSTSSVAQRLLEPVDAERLERACALRRGRDVPARREIAGHAPALVGVDHDLEVAADRVAHRLDDRDVVAPVGVVEAQLDRPHARVAQRDAPRRARSSGATSSPLDA